MIGKDAKGLKVGDACEFFDKDLPGWLGPAEVLFRRVHDDSQTFVIEFQGGFRRVSESHTRPFVTISAQVFPPHILRVVKKTHGLLTEEELDKNIGAGPFDLPHKLTPGPHRKRA